MTMTASTVPTPAATRTHADRQERIAAILDAAQARRCLGQAARHCRLPDGRHEVVLRGERFVASTLERVIDQARAGRQQP